MKNWKALHIEIYVSEQGRKLDASDFYEVLPKTFRNININDNIIIRI